MPTASGQLVLNDYVAELQALGFDGFTADDLTTYINRGYFHVARKSRWRWEDQVVSFTINPGDTPVSAVAKMPNFKSIQRMVITTANQRRRLQPLSDDQFLNNWAWQDFSVAQNWGEPDHYYVDGDNLYLLPAPQSARIVAAKISRRPVPLSNSTLGTTDVPITPQDLDEAILIAATIRCHRRAKELNLATVAEADLAEFIDDELDEEEWLMADRLERVSPDDTWL